jgi:hypothetical protein
MYTKVSNARPPADGIVKVPDFPIPPDIIVTVAMTDTIEKTNAVSNTDHQGTSGYKGCGALGMLGV